MNVLKKEKKQEQREPKIWITFDTSLRIVIKCKSIRPNVKDPDLIKEIVLNFYMNIYKESEQWRPDLELQGAAMITDEEQSWLQSLLKRRKLFLSINMCTMEKAPAPDGFSMIFFRTFWQVSKSDVMKTLTHFHSSQISERSFNGTLIALIPKKN